MGASCRQETAVGARQLSDPCSPSTVSAPPAPWTRSSPGPASITVARPLPCRTSANAEPSLLGNGRGERCDVMTSGPAQHAVVAVVASDHVAASGPAGDDVDPEAS